MYNYVQNEGGEEAWKPLPATKLAEYIVANSPMFATVLSVSSLVDSDMSREDIDKLTYSGPMYFDWDGEDPVYVASQTTKFLDKFKEMGVDLNSLRLYATGGKGFHCEVPETLWLEKPAKGGLQFLPAIFKEVALELAVDTIDFRVYSARKGRMWRRPNVLRPNGRYKVPVSYEEIKETTAESYVRLTSSPRPEPVRADGKYTLNLAMLFDKCKGKVVGAVGKRKKSKVASVSLRSDMPSLVALCEGRGIKPGTGFNAIAMQVALMAQQVGWTEEQTVNACEGLVSSHQSDGSRYNTEAKRKADIVRMYRYMEDNPCYDISIGALKTLLSHPAPDLDGIPVTKEDIAEAIEDAANNPNADNDEPDEYEGLAGVTVNKYGVYANTENGTRRVCAVSFTNVELLKSLETGTISAIEADIMVNGKRVVRQGLELDSFGSVQAFNKLCVRFGHAFQGNDANVRGLYMRVVEAGKKAGKEFYVTSREGLDIVNIPNHENELLREPFMLWADGRGVVLEPRVADSGLNIRFQGYPDTRGQFRIDLGDAPPLKQWLTEEGNKQELRETLTGMFNCQKPEVLGKMIGWTVACFYRMLFHKVYGKFPLLHVNAPAGTGKSEMSKALLGFFYYNQEPRVLSPSSTMFALSYSASGSTTPPLMIDEYKPHRMTDQFRERMKLMFRDAYNCREQQRGGGTRDNDDYRAIHTTTLSAPMAFIAEAVEEESAVMERVVLATLAKPHPMQSAKDFAQFVKWQRGTHKLAVLGQHIASSIVRKYSTDQLQEDFDALYAKAKAKYMLTDEDIAGTSGLTRDQMISKQNTKERTVFNYTVAAFGFSKLASLVNAVFGEEFTAKLEEIQGAIYERMDDLATTTQAEWLKVFNTFADMSYMEDSPTTLVNKRDYAIVSHGGRDCLEIYPRMCYHKYRIYCKATGTPPLYSGDVAFTHGLRDCQARLHGVSNLSLMVPGGSMVFDLDALNRQGFRGLKTK